MKRSKFSLSHYQLTTMDMGKLIPISWYEALPGDSIQHSTSCLIRVSPLLSPVMHPVRVRIHHWFVPNRLIWEDWENFITGGEDGDYLAEPPYMQETEVLEGSLEDHMGIPADTYTGNINFSALPFRAYNFIYDEYYRDQDLIDKQGFIKASGLDEDTERDIFRIAWEKDYFTTARPWEQKGSLVTIPLGDTAPVIPDGDGIPLFNVGGNHIGLSGQGDQAARWSSVSGTGNASWSNPKLETDLSAAVGVSVNDLRLALALQRYQEARAKYGSRYVEYLRSIGVRSSDARLALPEYLGGGKQVIQFSEVLQTAEGEDPVGSMKGHGIAAMRTNKFRRYFEEHGIVMTLMSVVPKTIYTQTLNRKFSRQIKEDFFQKELQTIGEQEVLNKEIYANHTQPDELFGYQARYDEYRSMPSGISGEFRSIMDHWHYGRVFAGDVGLNQSFIEANPTKRVNASLDTDCLIIMANHSIQARRGISKFAKSKTF